jgi:hypothetical protein
MNNSTLSDLEFIQITDSLRRRAKRPRPGRQAKKARSLYGSRDTDHGTRNMPNKPNSPIVQIHVTSFITVNYEIFASPTKVKFKPNSNPIFYPPCELTCFGVYPRVCLPAVLPRVGGKPDLILLRSLSKPVRTQCKPRITNNRLSLINNHLEGKPSSNPVSKRFAEPGIVRIQKGG